jgi:glycosyltransferase involved in cell wall biosynthesis
MKVALINHSDIGGGAARAAYRIHHALRRHGLDSRMYVNLAIAGDWTVQGPGSNWGKALCKVRAPLGGLLNNVLRTGNPVLHSPAILPSRWPAHLNDSDADLLHLHWVNFEMLSLADIGRLRKSVVWTLHDMWAFCGAEHLTEDNRWREGYTPRNRPSYESGFDLNRWTWQRKRKHWQRPMHIVTPSRWLAECVRQSVLMHDWPVTVVPNAIDSNVWQPVDKALARQLMHLPPDAPLLLFGALGGVSEPHKGFDLLKTALDHLRGQMPGMELIVFGQLAPRTQPELGFPIHYTGHLHDDISLRLLYSAVDALVIPSRLDNLPNTGVEALACGTPVVAFDTCGLPDIVEHEQTGYLAKTFETDDLARGIQWVLSDAARHKLLSQAAREKAVRCFDYPVVAQQYLDVYRKTIG